MNIGLAQAGFLGALAAVAIPIIVHLMFRLRTRRVDLGSLRFLREVLQKNAKRKRVKRLILLALRAACIALLAFLFARPYLIGQGTGSSDRFLAILIDRSASMQLTGDGVRLIDQAVDQAKEIIKTSEKNTRVEVAFFDHTVRPLGSNSANDPASATLTNRATDDAILLLDAPAATFGATDYGAALAWSRDVCVKAGSARKQLHIFTDLQRSGLDWSEVEPMPQDVEVFFHDLGRAAVNNVAVTAADVSQSLARPGDKATVNVTVFNAGPFSLKELPVNLHLHSNQLNYNQGKTISLEPGSIESLEFELPQLQAGLWQGYVEVETEDELSFDNRRYLAMMVAPPWKVLVVDGQPHDYPVLSETYFLETALRLAPPGELFADSPYDPTVVSLASGQRLPDLHPFDLVTLANVEGVTAGEAKRLADFVSAGGGLVIFSGDNVEGKAYRALDAVGLSAGKILGANYSNDLPWRIDQWDTEHSIFAPLSDPQHGDLRRLAFHAYTRIEPAKEAIVLAKFRGGDPALIQRDRGKGSVLWFTSTCDRQWSDWARSRLYLPMIHQMLGFLTGLNEGGPVRGSQIDAQSDFAADIEPGVYPRDRYWQVVNPSPRESETDRSALQEFTNRFALNMSHSDEAETTQTASLGPTTIELRDDELWHWFIFALLGLLCVESLLANRTTA